MHNVARTGAGSSEYEEWQLVGLLAFPNSRLMPHVQKDVKTKRTPTEMNLLERTMQASKST